MLSMQTKKIHYCFSTLLSHLATAIVNWTAARTVPTSYITDVSNNSKNSNNNNYDNNSSHNKIHNCSTNATVK